MKAFLDRRVFSRIMVQGDQWDEALQKLCIAQYYGDVELWVASTSIMAVERSLSAEYPAAAVRYRIVKLLDMFNIASVGPDEVAGALLSDEPNSSATLMQLCASRVKADCIVSDDPSVYASVKMPSVTVGEFMESVEEALGVVYGLEEF